MLLVINFKLQDNIRLSKTGRFCTDLPRPRFGDLCYPASVCTLNALYLHRAIRRISIQSSVIPHSPFRLVPVLLIVVIPRKSTDFHHVPPFFGGNGAVVWCGALFLRKITNSARSHDLSRSFFFSTCSISLHPIILMHTPFLRSHSIFEITLNISTVALPD